MFTNHINFKNFKNFKNKNKKYFIEKDLKSVLKENNQVINSLSKFYQDSFDKKNIKDFKKKFDYRIIGMGGSTLGAQAIYNFLKKK